MDHPPGRTAAGDRLSTGRGALPEPYARLRPEPEPVASAPDAVGPKPPGDWCTTDGWCWEHPRPHGENLYAVWGRGADDVFAAGDHGLVMHWDGTRWRRMDTGTDRPLYSLWGNDVMTAGGNDALLRLEGSAWSTVPNEHWNHALWGFDGPSLLAVEPGGRIYVSPDGGRSWSDHHHAQILLTSLWGPAPDRLVAVGGAGTLLRYDGRAWAPDPIPLDGIEQLDLQDVWGHGDQVFVATTEGTLHFDGATWTASGGDDAEIMYSVWGSGPDDVIAVGDAIMEYDGRTWTTTKPAHHARLRAVWSADRDHAFAVGECGAIMRRDAGQWSTVTALDGQRLVEVLSLDGVWGFGPDHVLAVGSEVLRYDGSRWTREEAPPGVMRAIWAASPSDVFVASGKGTVVHHDGTAWSDQPTGSALPLNAIWGSGPDDVFAVGNVGRIVHYDGSSWSTQPSGTGAFLESVWVAAPDDAWAGGDDGVLLHYDGAAWSSVEVPTDGVIGTLWGSGPRDVYAISSEDLLHFDGTRWAAVSDAPEAMLDAASIGPTALFGHGPRDIDFTGAKGALFHFDGVTWTPQDTGTAIYLHDGWSLPSGEAFLVGPCGAILHRGPTG